MNSPTSPCDHVIFVAKSSPEETWVPRRVTDRLTVRRLVNINPGRPRTSSTAAPRKPQHHRLWSPRSESKSFSFLKQAHGVNRSIKEAGERGGVAAPARVPAEPEEVPPPRTGSRHRRRKAAVATACGGWSLVGPRMRKGAEANLASPRTRRGVGDRWAAGARSQVVVGCLWPYGYWISSICPGTIISAEVSFYLNRYS
jgi:hypothetical protein